MIKQTNERRELAECNSCKWQGKAYKLDEFGNQKEAIYGWCTNSDISDKYRCKILERKPQGHGCIGYER